MTTKHAIRLMGEAEDTHIDMELTDEELAVLLRIAAAVNAKADQVGPCAPWFQIDGRWSWPTA